MVKRNGILSGYSWGFPMANVSNFPYSEPTSAQPQPKTTKKQSKRLRRGLTTAQTDLPWFQCILNRLADAGPVIAPAYFCNPMHCIHTTDDCNKFTIDWQQLPTGIHPSDGGLQTDRARRKKQQVENLAACLNMILQDGDVVVEFCAGSGYVALPLACLFPSCTFVLVDMKQPSLDIANERIKASGLKNVHTLCCFVDGISCWIILLAGDIYKHEYIEFQGNFDVGIALHGCGEATDMVQKKCVENQASYVLAPCCVGKIKHSSLSYPRSESFRQILKLTEYQVLAKAADFGHMEISYFTSNSNRSRRYCKCYIERDRNIYAEEHGFRTFLFLMYPREATPKNDILLGIAKDRTQAVKNFNCRRQLSNHNMNICLFGNKSNIT